MYGQDIFCGIHTKYFAHTFKDQSLMQFWNFKSSELLDLRAHMHFWNAPPGIGHRCSISTMLGHQQVQLWLLIQTCLLWCFTGCQIFLIFTHPAQWKLFTFQSVCCQSVLLCGSLPIWCKSSTWGDHVLCTISRSIAERSQWHVSFEFLWLHWGVS